MPKHQSSGGTIAVVVVVRTAPSVHATRTNHVTLVPHVPSYQIASVYRRMVDSGGHQGAAHMRLPLDLETTIDHSFCSS